MFDAAHSILTKYNIPITQDARRWFAEGREDRKKNASKLQSEGALHIKANKQQTALDNAVKFKAYGVAARLAGWLYEHNYEPPRILTVSGPAALHIAHVIASRYEEII